MSGIALAGASAGANSLAFAPANPVVLAGFVDALGQFLRPGNLASVFVDGLSKAAIYVMIAGGLTLIFGLMGVLNFAHGSLTMIGAYLGGLLMVTAVGGGSGPVTRLLLFFVALAATFAVLAGLGGAMEVGLIRRLYDRPPIYQILLTFGLTLILDELVRIVVLFYGLQPTSDWQAALGTKPAFLSQSVEIGGLSVAGLDLFEIALGALTVAALWAFLTRTRYGLIIRAGSEDAEMTEALGIDVRRVFTVVFALGAGVAGAAGMLLMWDPAWAASVPLGADTLLPAFVVVIVGGLGTFRGTVVAALLVGMVDAVMTWWFVNEIEFAGLPEMTIFLILVVMLILRPQGLFGVEEVGGH
ncbi:MULTISPECIES: branched-chain amino acid ABC transporter permease [Halorussus]|uniref:branched-chain amino acid ABC transporter permease n=1 Tax=Halorussus TaxID=1070314 RepID=UPI00209EB281|nr:branched-chain amino acid ABC transporter permease [Halorussus vallis]USZ75107.1 branched-chain amino acid ABC transporter permease [Halorussus vallis]